jgi:hypothetical protein
MDYLQAVSGVDLGFGPGGAGNDFAIMLYSYSIRF